MDSLEKTEISLLIGNEIIFHLYKLIQPTFPVCTA